MSQLFLSETVVITKGYGVRATTIEGQYAFALSLCALRKFHVTDSQNTRDQIASDRKSKRTWSNCLLCIPFNLSGSPKECWPFSSPEPLGLISNEFKTTWPRNDRLWGRDCLALLSTTTVLFRTTFTWTIKLNLLKWLLGSNLSQ